MTTNPIPAGGDPHRLLSDARALAHRVRRDQRVTWVALAVLAAVTLVAIPVDWYLYVERCAADGSCAFWRRGSYYYWPPALLLAYTTIAVCYVRVARSKGLGTRVLPYALTGVALAALSATAFVLARHFWFDHPPAHPFPSWVMLLDRLIWPAGTIGVALLVLARLERNVALLAFALGYLAVVLTPIDFGWSIHTGGWATFLPQQVINGLVLLLGAVGFAMAGRRQR